MYGNQYADEIRRQREQAMAAGVTPGQLRAARQTIAGTTDPYAQERATAQDAAGVSTKGLAAKIAQQEQMAKSMRDRGMGEGRTVGPYDTYVGPNIGDTIAGVTGKLAGAYMSKKNQENMDILDQQEAAKAKAEVQLEDIKTREERDFTRSENETDRLLKQALADQTAKTALAGQDITRRGQNITAATAAAKLAQDNTNAAEPVDRMLSDGRRVTVVEQADGTYRQFNDDGTLGSIVNMSGSKPIPKETTNRNAEASLAELEALEGKQDRDPMGGISTPRTFTNFLSGDYFDSATGVLDYRRWLAPYGLGRDGEMTQALQQDGQKAILEEQAKRMSEINLKPWTPPEIENIMKGMPSLNDEYPAWANYTINSYRRKILDRFDIAIEAGDTTPEAKVEEIHNIDKATVIGARKNGMTMKQLEELGMPRESIVRILKEIEAGV